MRWNPKQISRELGVALAVTLALGALQPLRIVHGADSKEASVPSAKAYRAVRGHILLSSASLPSFGTDAEFLAAVKESGKGKLKKQDEGNWPLYFMAFFKQAPGGGAAVALVFSQGKADNVTSVVDLGVKPTQTVTSSNVTLSPNQGFESGKTYLVRVVAQKAGKESVLAETSMSLE